MHETFRNTLRRAPMDNRPLTGAEQHLRVRTDRELQVRRALSLGLNALVLGEPGSGKTTLLRAIADDPPAQERTRGAVYLNLRACDSATDILTMICAALGLPGVPPDHSSHGTLRMLRLAESLAEAPPTLLCLDDPPAGPAILDLFARLRDTLWRSDHAWLVGAHAARAQDLTADPAGVFFETSAWLGPWDPLDELELLIRRLGKHQAGELTDLVKLSDGRPRSILTLARRVTDGDVSVEQLTEQRRVADARIGALPPTHQDTVRYMELRSTASAADPDFLAYMRFSAQRARKVLGELHQSGLTIRADLRRRGPGRPGRLYMLSGELR